MGASMSSVTGEATSRSHGSDMIVTRSIMPGRHRDPPGSTATNSRQRHTDEIRLRRVPQAVDGDTAGMAKLLGLPQGWVLVHQQRDTDNGPMRSHPATKIDILPKMGCGARNNGWMQQLETAVRPVLTPLLMGSSLTLSRQDMDVIA